MAAIVIVAHAPLASTLRQTVAHLFPDAAKEIDILDVEADAARADTCRQIGDLVARHAGAEVLLLTDVYGATPCNAASDISQQAGVRLVAGVNLPMLWRAVQYRDKPLDELAERAIQGAQTGIVKVVQTRPQNQNPPRSSDDQDHGDHQQ